MKQLIVLLILSSSVLYGQGSLSFNANGSIGLEEEFLVIGDRADLFDGFDVLVQGCGSVSQGVEEINDERHYSFTAIPESGCRFVGWEIDTITACDNPDCVEPTLTLSKTLLTLTSSVNHRIITAVFKPSTTTRTITSWEEMIDWMLDNPVRYNETTPDLSNIAVYNNHRYAILNHYFYRFNTDDHYGYYRISVAALDAPIRGADLFCSPDYPYFTLLFNAGVELPLHQVFYNFRSGRELPTPITNRETAVSFGGMTTCRATPNDFISSTIATARLNAIDAYLHR